MSNTIPLPTKWPTLQTPNVTAIVNLLLDAQENGRFLAIGDKTGYGKTTGINYYLNLKGTANAFKAIWDTTMGKKDALKAILKAMHIEFEGSIHAMIMTIVRYMVEHPKTLLIIDTSGELCMAMFRLIQVIYDQVHDELGECGIVLCGTDDFRKYILKMAAKGKIGFPELKRRIEYWLPLSPPSIKYVTAVCGVMEIADKDTIQYVHDHCKNYGDISNILRAYALAVNNGKAQGTALETLKGLRFGDSDYNISVERRTKHKNAA